MSASSPIHQPAIPVRGARPYLMLHCPAGGGHRAAAEALAEQARQLGRRALVVDALTHTPRWFARSYVGTHLTGSGQIPQLYGFGYARLNRRHPGLDGIRRGFDRAIGAHLLEAVHELDPAAVIATHFYPLSVLAAERLAGRLQAPLVGVVTDYTAHAFWAEPGVDMYVTAPGSAPLELSRHGVPRSHIVATGIPVRGAFGALPPPSFHEGRPLGVLMTSGGFGIGPLEAAIRSFAGLGQLRLTVVCGKEERRAERARRAAESAGVEADIVGFESNMPDRLAEAQVVVGKPGGLTVSEALAAGRPMALFGTCPGQEQHNEEWLCLNGAAVVTEPDRCGPRLARLVHTGELARMASAARLLGRPHAARDALCAVDRLVEAASSAHRAVIPA